MSELNTAQPLQFDIMRDFELRSLIEKTNDVEKNHLMDKNISEQNIPEQNIIEQMDNMVRTLPYINDNIRKNIGLGIEIYKQLNNFDHNYIHSVINENSTKSDK